MTVARNLYKLCGVGGVEISFRGYWIDPFESNRLSEEIAMKRIISSRKSSPKQNRRLLECLECRHLLAAEPVISEIQTNNTNSLLDEDGETSEWIEIHNPSSDESIDLGGWFLTDNQLQLTKWQFPAKTIPPNESIVVFASGKDRANQEQLHTNFRLDEEGFVGLVEPDGQTVAYEIASYPELRENESYGLTHSQEVIRLIGDETQAKIFVPADDSFQRTWTEDAFDDSGWNVVDMPVGYETPQAGFRLFDSFDNLGDRWTLDIPDGGTSTVQVADGRLVIDLPRDQHLYRENPLAPLVYQDLDALSGEINLVTKLDTSTVRMNGGIVVVDPTTNRPVLVLEYDRGLRVRLRNAEGESVGANTVIREPNMYLRLNRNAETGKWNGFFRTTEADEWTMIEAENGGIELPLVAIPKAGLFAASGTSAGTVRFDFFEMNVSDAEPFLVNEIASDLNATLRDQNSSLYMRIPFQMESDPAELDSLAIGAQFDDGFVAYLNGQEIVRQNAPQDLTWNSQATENREGITAPIVTQSFDISANISSLKQGENVLAIHGLNFSSSDRDFFFNASMVGLDFVGQSVGIMVNPTPGTLNSMRAAPSPQIVAEQGVFVDETSVSIALDGDDPELAIHYTLDGSEPTLDSPRYIGPLMLTESAMLQAKTFDIAEAKRFDDSRTESGTFIGIDETITQTDSDLPVLVLDTLRHRLQNAPSGGLQDAFVPANAVLFEKDELTGRTRLDNNLTNYLGRVGIRDGTIAAPDGTGGQPKPTMIMDTWGTRGTRVGDNEAVELLGMPADSQWVLYAPYVFDRTLIHEQFAFELSRQMGHYAPRFREVEVYLNERTGFVSDSHYAGVYVLIEFPKQAAHRIAVDELNPSITATPEQDRAENISGGYVWYIDRQLPGNPALEVGGQLLNWIQPQSPRSREVEDDQRVTDTQLEWVENHFSEMVDSLNDTESPRAYENYIDVESWIDYHLLSVLMFDVDALRLATFVTKDRNEKIAMGPIWDTDRALESADDRDDNPNVWRSESGDRGTDFFGNTSQEWWGDLFQNTSFWQSYVDQWQDLRLNILSDENIEATVTRLAEVVRESSERNFAAHRAVRPRSGSSYPNNRLDRTWQGEVNNMLTWLKERAAFIDSNFSIMPTLQIGDEVVQHASSVVDIASGETIILDAPQISFVDDAVLVSGENGVAEASFFVPVNDDLGESWTAVGFDDTNWTRGGLGVGFGESNGFEENITTNIRPTDVHPDATNVLMRIPFQLGEVETADQLVLRMKYDDGFVVHLNGERILQHNLRDPAAWNSRARSHRNSEAIEFEDFDLTEHFDKLRVGENILAIRGINSSSNSNDLLFQPSLVLRDFEFGRSNDSTIYYTLDGTDPRGLDGEPTEQALVAEGGVPIVVRSGHKIFARNLDTSDRGVQAGIVGTDWSGPLQLRVVSNEICADHNVSQRELSIPQGAIDVRDVNGNLQSDIVSAEGNWYGFDNRLGTFERNGKTNLGSLEAIAWSDVNGDGRTDAIGITPGLAGSDTVSWSEALDDGRSFGAANVITHDDGQFHSIDSFDVDRDGDSDIVADSELTGIVWFENLDGDGHFNSMQSLGIDSRFEFLTSHDVDSDGLSDLIVSSDQQRIHWLRNNGQQEPFVDVIPISRNADVSSLMVVNLNDDQTTHLILRSFDGDSILVYQQDGRGFSVATLPSPETTAMTVLDVDRDNDLDVVANSNGTLSWFANQEAGSRFSDAQPIAAGIHADALFAGDFDGDGIGELLTSSNESGVSLLHLNCQQPVIGDSNRDGIFNSADLTHVFQAGEFEDSIDGNSAFEEGDWNGDGDFNSADFVFAFKNGDYSFATKPNKSN